MRRIRITLLLVTLVLSLPVALLVNRALESVALERAVQHEAVAQRAFDEMERALLDFLEREEARPFDDYAAGGPLSRRTTQRFVVGHFQIDPDGSFHAPLAGTTGSDDAVATLERLVSGAWLPATRRDAPAAPDPETPAPGGTLALQGKGLGDAKARAAKKNTAYDLLQSLNRASDLRAERQQKVTLRQRRSGAREARKAEDLDLVGRERLGLRDESVEGRVAPAEVPEARAPEAQAFLDEAFVESERVALDPMLGRAAGPDHLLLYRTVVVDAQGIRQGLLIDRAELGDWLGRQVIEPSGLGRVAVARFTATGQDTGALPDSAFAFRHRFGEPFDSLRVDLAMDLLPGSSSALPVYALSALLFAAGAVGLIAIYRMVSVTVDYADRRNRFVAAVSHELKTPLTAIRMYGEMLRDGLVQGETKRDEYYRTITDESERLSRLIDNVLEFSRLERGGRELDLRAGSLSDAVREIAEKLVPHARREGFDLRVELAEDLPTVRFDRDAVVQVVFNLVDNAIKYARDAATREIVLECRRAEGGGALLDVRDFGPGVSPRQLGRVFEPFYRGRDELTRTTRGTGIGLALVKELAERMGARLESGNAEGGGFRVRLAFPTASGDAPVLP